MYVRMYLSIYHVGMFLSIDLHRLVHPHYRFVVARGVQLPLKMDANVSYISIYLHTHVYPRIKECIFLSIM